MSKVVVGMSGGVDSSVAAMLLKEQGHEVIGATMAIWQEEEEETLETEGGCCGLSAVDDARRVADKLEIPYYVMNFREDFKEKVIEPFISEYKKGRTPNPCIDCNRYVKWESLLHRSLEIGAEYVATGHYARIKRLPNGRYTLAKSVTAEKDQTYALYNLTQFQLAHTLMPVGEYEKPQIRELARQAGLLIANKPDSQDICFVKDNDYAGFIQEQSPGAATPGMFVDEEGTYLGTQKGVLHYTVGQRKGLGIALGKPAFVKELNPEKNQVVLTTEEERLFVKTIYLSQVNYMAVEGIQAPTKAVGKIRYSHKGAACKLTPLENGWLMAEFEEPQRAPTPGQAAVFYEEDYILCGGIIENALLS